LRDTPGLQTPKGMLPVCVLKPLQDRWCNRWQRRQGLGWFQNPMFVSEEREPKLSLTDVSPGIGNQKGIPGSRSKEH